MPNSLHLAIPPLPAPGELTTSERFTRTLVTLTRTVWHPECTFETAIASICEAAANALQVERVSVWRYEAAGLSLRCLSAYDGTTGEHEPVESLETLSLQGDDYIAALEDVRTLDAAAIQSNENMAGSHLALLDYLQRHRIHAMLDAPAFVGGELHGVICHESILRVRSWSREEATFAASMGDYVAMAFEIARRRRAEAEVEHLRLHDAATGLPNRDYMMELLRQRLANPRHNGNVPAVLHVQVDTSGSIAWPAGAPTVDEAIARIARCLRTVMRDDVELARTGLDAFTFLVSVSPAGRTFIRLAEDILAALQALDWSHAEVDPNATIGIAVADHEVDLDAHLLLARSAEAAMRARSAERFAYAIYDEEHHASLIEAMRADRALRDAFANGHLELHYQPEYDAHAGHWVAAEALLRWRDGERLVIAGEFIDALEASQAMLAVGRWALRQACQDAAGWPLAASGQPITVRVNVSALQFDGAGLVEDVRAALAASGLDPAQLCLELTETTLMRDIGHALEILHELRGLGVQVAIDDFGTGYASLVYLKRLPIDAIKIDGSFVQGMPDNAGDAAIVQALVSLAAAFDIEVVAECVELSVHRDALLSIGVHRMQGWFYGKAMEQRDLCRVLDADFIG